MLDYTHFYKSSGIKFYALYQYKLYINEIHDLLPPYLPILFIYFWLFIHLFFKDLFLEIFIDKRGGKAEEDLSSVDSLLWLELS